MKRHPSDEVSAERHSSAWQRINAAFVSLSDDLAVVWHEGDEYGGAVMAALERVAAGEGLYLRAAMPVPAGQKLTPPHIRIECFKRDNHRCVVCGATLGLRIARLPHAVGRQVTSVDDVVVACTKHMNGIRAGTEKRA